jgi:uncharacterized protein YdaU (DUF1376 family)
VSKPTAWMPLYVGDYLRDTSHLTTHQHGAYLLLIMHYWSTGQALPDDDLRLSNITRVPPHLWNRTRRALTPFFKVENGRWYHERIERELIEAFDRKDAAIARGKRGAEARWNGRPSMLAPSVKHSSSPSPSIYHESGSESLTDAAREPAPDSEAPARAQASLVPERPPGTESPEARDLRLRLAEITAAKRAAFLKGNR